MSPGNNFLMFPVKLISLDLVREKLSHLDYVLVIVFILFLYIIPI